MNNKHKDISESKPDVNRPCPTRTPAGKSRVAFVTFGCRLNKAEALDLESTYAASGWKIVTLKHGNHKECKTHCENAPHTEAKQQAIPDLIIVRGCSVTARAQRDCEKSIAHLREQFPNTPIKITGCLNITNATKTHSTESCDNPPTPRMQVELGVFADNERARHLYRKLGFTEMGCIPKAFLLKDGTYRDEVQMVKFL